MANGTKVYNITINGLKESVSQVDALITKLDNLQQRLDKISSMGIKLNSGGGGGNVVQELTAEDKLFNSIYNTEVKIEEARNQNFQYLVKIKDELKQVTVEQKAAAAASKLEDNNYNLETVAGMKERLKDIKAALQTTNTGSDLFTQLSKEANELNNKLKLIEAQYGQFGRNVGNYTSALGGLSAITVTVGDTEVQFKNATIALREMKRQMDNLRSSGKMNTQEFKNLNEAYKTLQRTSQGMSAQMAQMLNAMQSIGAVASITGGLSTLFGNKNNDIQKNIQRLLALQSVLQGIDNLRKQMQASKGIGAALAAGSSSVDSFVAKLTGAKVTTEGLTMATNGATKAVRAFSTALKGMGIGLAIAALMLLFKAFENVSKQVAEGVSKMDAFNASLEASKKLYQSRIETINASYTKGEISTEEYLNEKLKEQNNYLKTNIDLLEQRSKSKSIWQTLAGRYATKGVNLDNPLQDAVLTGWTSTTTVKSIEQVKQKWTELNQELKRGVGFWDGIFGKTSNNHVALSNVVLSDFIKRVKDVDLTSEGAKEEVDKLYDEMNNDEVLSSVLLNLDKLIPAEEARKLINGITESLSNLRTAANETEERLQRWDIEEKYSSDPLQKQMAELELQYKKDIQQYGTSKKEKEAIDKVYAKRRQEIRKQMGARTLQDENEIQRRLISAMKDGLNKQLKELELERKQAQEQAVQSERMVNEKLLAINKEFDKKVLDAKREYKEQMVQLYNDMWTQIYEKQMEIETMMSNASMAQQENRYTEEERRFSKRISKSPYTKGYSVDYANVSEAAKEMFRGHYSKEISDAAAQYKVLNDQIKMHKRLIAEVGNLREEEVVLVSKETIALEKLMNSDFFKQNKEEILEAVNFASVISTDSESETLEKQFDHITEDLRYYYGRRLVIMEDYFNEKESIEKEQAQKEYEFNRQEELRNYELLMDSYKKQRKAELDGLVEDENYQENRKAIVDKYNELIDTSTEQHQRKLEALEKNHTENLKQIETTYLEDRQKEWYEYHQLIIKEYENFSNKLSAMQSNFPVYDNSGWNIVDIAATKKRNQEVIDGAKALAGQIIQEKEKLKEALEKGEISFVDWKVANDQLTTLQEQVVKTADTAVKNGKNIIGEFISSINQYVQAIGNGLQTILQSVADYEDSIYNHQMEMLEKHISDYEEALDKQKEITEKYADNINDIEDELSDARGDRRQQLIDMLNQQKAAQRASLNEEKKIEKEKEAMEQKKEQLEQEQKKREHKRAITDAIISAALAVVNGLATKPFVPVGIAMGALAGALGAVQVALIKSQKYAQGGMLEGKSHAQGGIKTSVGNRPIELEGQEYVIRKATATKNLSLLDYVNRSEKKLNLSDFIDFYGGKVNGSLKKQVKTKFADGGQLPTLRNDITLDSRFVNALNAYADRPSYVSVVEILDKADDVNNIRAIAGLED